MAAYAWFYAGSAHLKAERPDAARKAFAEVPVDSPLSPRAGEKLAESWIALDRPDRAIAALGANVTRHPSARGSSWFRLAKLREAAGDAAGAAEAWRELAARKPRSPRGPRGAEEPGEGHGLTPAQLLGIAMASYRAQAHRDALRGFEEVLDATDKDTEVHCEARTKIARTYEKMKKRKVAWRHYAKALGCTGEPLADATFAGGRNRLRAEDYERGDSCAQAPRQGVPDALHRGRRAGDDRRRPARPRG